MNGAYVDTSVLVCRVFGEPGWNEVQATLDQLDVTLASNLLEAEFRSTLMREQVEVAVERWLAGIRWIFPDRRLSPEFDRVLSAGYVRGADLWHLACALYVSPDPSELLFLTLDERQRSIAKAIGFQTEMG
ncbi:MAG: type II toxin-antitoxin system VapC family toxin [Bradymonadales bacterium]|nr:type II toxin-antitoxin system VapC family toxin [Bradymonadales bacterium]